MRVVFVLSILAAAGIGLRIYRASVGRPIWERIGVGVAPFLALTVAWHWVVSVAFDSVAGFWNGVRLAPAMGLVRGYTLYYRENEGPLNGWVYGPVASFAYLPAALLGNSGVKILVARALSLVYYYGPAAWLLLGAGPGTRRRPGLGGVLLFFTFVLLTAYSRALRYSSTEVHADAPALGLAALAIAVMVRGGGGANPRACCVSLLLAVLAVWSKQNTVAILLVVLPGYATLTGASRSPFRSFGPAFLGGLGITIALLALLGPGSLLFNFVSVPAGFPTRIHLPIDYLYPLVALQQKYAPVMLLLFVGLLGRAAAAARPECGGEDRARLRAHEGDWPVFLVSGAAQVPFAVAAFALVGADENSMSFFIYFTTLGALLLLKPLLRTGDDRPRDDGCAWYSIIGLALMLAIVEQETLGGALARNRGAWRDSIVAERFIRDHRGEVYFPWNPQSHLQVEGVYYHFEYGIYDRILSGYPPSREHLLRHIPPRTRLICYPANAVGVAPIGVLRYLKGFRQTEVAGLPGWSCYERAPAGEVPREEPGPPGNASDHRPEEGETHQKN